MRSSIYGRWIRGHYFQSHVLIPAVFTLLLIGMYFSGSVMLQSFVAGSPLDPDPDMSRELHALGLLQVVFLLCAAFFSLRSLVAARGFGLRFFSLLVVVLVVSTLAGETDYGRHLGALFSGQAELTPREAWEQSWRARGGATTEKIDGALLLGIQLGVLALFALLPPLINGSRNPNLALISPTWWASICAVLAIVLWRLAAGLNGAGHAVLDGEAGNLDRYISEFLELDLYYLAMLYCAILNERLIARLEAPIARRKDF